MTPGEQAAQDVLISWTSIWVTAIIGGVTLIVAIASLVTSHQSRRNDKEGYLAEMRREWDSLGPEWHKILMYVYGPNWYYHSVPTEERKAHERLRNDFDKGGPDSFERQWQWAREKKRHVEHITRFLVGASDSITTGRWTVMEAYALLGNSIARHYEILLWLARQKPLREIPHVPLGAGGVWGDNIDSMREENTHDQHDAIIALAYLMRAEQCRRGDTYAHFVVELAEAMRQQEGRVARLAAHRTARNRGRLFPRWEITYRLHRAAFPWKRSAFEYERTEAIVGEEKWFLFRRPYETVGMTARRIRAIRAKTLSP